MAGDWIKMRTNLWDDPRISGLCDATGQSEAAVIGSLYWLWAMADEHTVDGTLPNMTAGTIDRKTGVKGIGSALVAIGWISESNGGVIINSFEEHNGTSAKKRCSTAKRVSNHRSGNAEVTQGSLQDAHEGVTDALSREEKRREDSLSARTVTPIGAFGMALKRAGVNMAEVQMGDPMLKALIDQGATPDEFEALAREAIASGINKPFKWLLKVLPERRERAAALRLVKTGEADEDRMAKFRGGV